MSKNTIPVGMIDAELYFDGSNNLAGIGEVTLPKIELQSITTEQFGMTGTYKAPLPGHVGELETEITFDSIDGTVFNLTVGESIMVECKAAAVQMDKSSQSPNLFGIDATLKGTVREVDALKLKSNEKLGTKFVMSISYYKLVVDGNTIYDIDIFNGKSEMNGKDKGTEVRRLMGL